MLRAAKGAISPMSGSQAPTTTKRIDFIDLARGFAILAIVVYHCLQTSATGILAKGIMLGGAGVHVFVILSGFGLALSSSSKSPVAFYGRRLTKLLIPYFAFLTIAMIVNTWFVLYPGDGFYAYLGRVFFFGIFDASITHAYGFPLWFISVIVQLYLLFPLLSRVRSRMGNGALVASGFIVSAVFWILTATLDIMRDERVVHCSAQYLWGFCAGMALANVYASRRYRFWEQRTAVLLAGAVIGLGLLGLSGVVGGPVLKTLNDVPSAVGFTCVIALVYKVTGRGCPKLQDAFGYLGRVSLELYLLHYPVILAVKKIAGVGRDQRMALHLALLAIPLSLGASILYAVASRFVARGVSSLRRTGVS